MVRAGTDVGVDEATVAAPAVALVVAFGVVRSAFADELLHAVPAANSTPAISATRLVADGFVAMRVERTDGVGPVQGAFRAPSLGSSPGWWSSGGESRCVAS